MPVDIKSVDPAIVKAGQAGQGSEIKRTKILPPPFQFLLQSLQKTEDGFSLPVSEDSVVIHTADDKYFSVNRAVLAKSPIKISSEVTEIPFSQEALAVIVHWCEKHGVDGKSESTFVLPVTHTDFNLILQSDWEKQFNTNILSRPDFSDVYIPSINAADSLGLTNLVDFLIVGLGCAIR
eukprot:CAMPEP_0176446258 /NCGR_PEP_ID=MMETSP0127-20121128/24209_1 /TAXON_ID=938130 /ORGANISM="Platyophrya macrostoma, Strain WH" /LENGTH=178 /DNA_ID=CAMNT_0017832239 /DNA_START=45 /DNA_END=577 /DNA_ORIENTATION=-